MKRRSSLVGIIVLCLVASGVSGCVNAQIAALRDRCTFSNDPRFAVLKGKIPLSPVEAETPPSLSEISNDSIPTPVESRAIYAYDEATKPCISEATQIVARAADPSVLAILTTLHQNNLIELKRLANRQITFGQYRQVTYNNLLSANKELAIVQHNAAVVEANRQASSAALIAAGAQLILAPRAPNFAEPITTNCRRVGQFISCQSF